MTVFPGSLQLRSTVCYPEAGGGSLLTRSRTAGPAGGGREDLAEMGDKLRSGRRKAQATAAVGGGK